MLNRQGETENSLSLALGARRAVKSLMALQGQEKQDPSLQKAVTDVVTSLNAISAGGLLFGHLTAPSNFEHYDQIETLAEVQSAFHDTGLAQRLEAVITTSEKFTDREESIRFAISFFTALESRATQKYNQAVNYRY